MNTLQAFLGIAFSIIFTVYGQIVVKWQVSLYGALPVDPVEKVFVLMGLILKPWMLSAFIAAFLAAFSWMAVLSKMPLSYAYPFMSVTFALVLIFSVLLFGETMNWQKVVGVAFILAGISISSQG